MEHTRARLAILQVAAEHGVTVEEVYAQMQLAICEAMRAEGAAENDFWKAWRQAGRVPTPEEFIEYFAKSVL